MASSAAAAAAAGDQFASRLSPGQDYAYGAVVAGSGALAYVGNMLVVLMFYRRRRELQTAEHLLLHLTVSTLLMMMVTCPLVAVSALSHRWIFGETGCIAHGSLSYFFGVINITSLLSVSVIRYIKTCCIHTGRINQRETSAVLLVMVYVWAAFWSLCPLLGWGSYGIEQHHLSCSLLWNPDSTGGQAYILLAAIFVIFLPIAAMAFCYVKIAVSVRASHEKVKIATRKKQNHANLNLVSLVLVLGFVLAWLPYALVSVLGALAGHALAGPGAVAVVTALAKSSGCYNPVIYMCFSRHYREQLLALLGLAKKARSQTAGAPQGRARDAGRVEWRRHNSVSVADDDSTSRPHGATQTDVTGISDNGLKIRAEKLYHASLETEL